MVAQYLPGESLVSAFLVILQGEKESRFIDFQLKIGRKQVLCKAGNSKQERVSPMKLTSIMFRRFLMQEDMAMIRRMRTMPPRTLKGTREMSLRP